MAGDTIAQYLDDDGNPVGAGSDVKPPKGYSLLTSKKSPAASNKKASVKELKILAAAKKPIVPPSGYFLSAPPDLSVPADNKEGLYSMYGRIGKGDEVGEFKTPYSKVQSALQGGSTFYNGSGTVYDKDKAAEGKPVSWYQQIVQSPSLAPVPHEQLGAPIGNKERAVARTILATPAYVKQLWDAAQSMHRGEVSGGDEFANLINPFQIPKQMYDQFKEDAKTDPKMAVDNLLGSAVGLGLVGAATHGVTKAVGAVPEHVQAIRDKFTPVTETPVRERTNVLHRNTAGEVRQAKGQAPSVWLSPDAWKSFMGSLYPGEDAAATHGVNLPASADLHAFANDAQLSAADPHFGEVQQLLAKAHENAGEGGVAIGKQRPSIQSNVNVMREELNHTWQRGLANGNVTSHLKPEAFTELHQAIPQGMQDHLVDQGYDGESAPEMVTEAAAKLMGGDLDKFGVTPEEASDFMRKYLDKVVEQHGSQALDSLKHVRGAARQVKEAVDAEHAGKANAAGADGGLANGSTDRGVLPSVSAGGQRTPEPVQSAGGEGQDALFNRDKDRPAWYLKSERLIGDKMKGPQAAEDVHKMLISGGVKPEEMQWTGLDDFLKSKGKDKVTPEEIREHLENNNIVIKEITKGARSHGTPLGADEVLKAIETGEPVYGVGKDTGLQATTATTGLEGKKLTQYLSDNQKHFNIYSGEPTPVQLPKFSKYVLPGGESYREMLLTMPDRTAPPREIEFNKTDEYQGEPVYTADVFGGKATIHHNPGFPWRIDLPRGENEGGFKTAEEAMEHVKKTSRFQFPIDTFRNFVSSHWEEPNILAHTRFNDRTGPNGEKLLHVEEVQSDWMQRGRDKGFTNEKMRKDSFQKTKELYSTARDIIDSKVDRLGFDSMVDAMRAVETHSDWVDRWDARSSLTPEEIKAVEDWRSAKAERDRVHSGGAVPDAPFKKTWHEMTLRRLLKHAVDNGYDGLSWTPGEDQAARYSLRKQVDNIEVPMVNEDGSRSLRIDPIGGGHDSFKMMVSPDGTVDGFHSASQFTGKKLDEVIGKEMAKKVMEVKDPSSFSGEGLEVGGEGMKGFYDKIVPDYLNKFGKKFGSKVGETKIPVLVEADSKGGFDYHFHDGRYYVGQEEETSVANFNTREEAAAEVDRLNKELLEGRKKSVQYLPITPEMRKSVAEEGVPLFNREVPGIKRDNPGGNWLKENREYTEQRGRNKWGVFNSIGKATGYSHDRFLVPVDILKDIPGARGENPMSRDPERAEGIAENFRKTGLLPQVNGSDYHPFIMIDQEGKPWVNEGNHRIAGAALAGVKYLPVEVRYFNGGEQEKGVLSPDSLTKFHEDAIEQGYTPENYAEKNKEDATLFNRERRVDSETRKRVSEMSPEEMRKALLTSDKTGIPNRRAFDDAEHVSPSPAIGMSDADGLKALNDKFGYAAGDELLKAKAEALQAAGLDAYHEKGDEFLYRGESPESLKEKLEKAREILRGRTIEATLKDGNKLYFKGADFSYGTGKNLDESEDGLKQHKQSREDAGERARGELRGIAQVESEDGGEHQGDTSVDNSDILRNREKPEEETPSAEQDSPTDLDVNTNEEADAEKIPEQVEVSTGTGPTTVIPIQGGTQLVSAPQHEPVEKVHTSVPHQTTATVSVPLQTAIPDAPVVTTRVLPLAQLKAMAAGLNPQRQPKSVREVMEEAKARMGNSIVP